MSEINIETIKENSLIPMDKFDKIFQNIPIIFSRIETALDKPFKVIDQAKLEKIEERLKEQNEKMYIFGRSDTAHTRKLMTLAMLDTADSTYRVIKQILAQIEKKQSAITHSYFKLKKQYVTINEIEEKIKNETDDFKKQKLHISYQEKQVNVSNSFIYLEGALKEIGLLQDAYDQIKKNKDIPDDWDEMDFEKAEIRAHIKGAFRNCVRDFLCHGRIGMGTCEYFEQFGISPAEAIYHVQNYIQDCNVKSSKVQYPKDYDHLPNYEHLHEFLDKMVEIYNQHYKKACSKIGLDNVISSDFLLMSSRNKEQLKIEEGE